MYLHNNCQINTRKGDYHMGIQEMFSLQDRVAVVTGGSVGLGFQMASGLAEAGANVVLAARKIARCEEAAERISRETGVKAVPVACDVGKEEDVEALIKTTMKEFGRIDILVNNAGVGWGGDPETFESKGWHKVMNINLHGAFYCCQQAGRVMIDQKKGKIINIGSIHGFVAAKAEVTNSVAYMASKGAMVMLTRDLAAKWAQYNINVNGIAPGYFPTDMTDYTREHGSEPILRHVPLGRLGGDDDLKGAAIYLASEASNYVTGHILVVDGGYMTI